jgi:phage protein D
MAEPIFEQPRNMPGFRVLAGGAALPDETALDILDVCVSDYVTGASMFTVAFNAWHSRDQDFKWLDDEILREGTVIEVQVGFVDHFTTLIVGEVTALEPVFPEDAAPTLIVHGYDRLHRFRRGRKTRSFSNMKDSEVAAQIARNLQLRAQVVDTQVTHDYLLQHNQTDIDFLLERARRIRYEVTVRDHTLYFRPAANDQGEVISLTYGLTLKCFSPRLSTMRQVSEVVVQGWNPKTKAPITVRARQGDEVSTMHGTDLGTAISERAFFPTASVIACTPIYSDGEALQIARAKYNDMAVDFITGEGKATGNTAIRAGQVLDLQGLGQRFSGLYYVTSSTHIVDQNGYTTTFTVERNAT